MSSSGGRFKVLWMFSAILAPVVLLPGLASGQEAEKCLLWKVTSKTTTIYLLGSMHVANADFFPLAKEIEDAYAESKKLVVEVNIDLADLAKADNLVKDKGFYGKGQSLSKNLSKKTMAAFRNYCTKKGLNAEIFEPMRPWVVYLNVTLAEVQAIGLNLEGIDRHFLKKARADKKPVLELETMEDQLDLFAGFSPELQETLLARTLAGQGEIKRHIEKMAEAWKKGDVAAIEHLTLGDVKRYPEQKAVLEKMYDERNVKMVEKIDGYLKGKEPVFVVIGAGHMVGPKGIVHLLEDKGYQVTQVARAAAMKKAK